MIIITTDSISGKKIEKYLEVVIASDVVGVNIFRDIFTKIRDIFGGYSVSYKKIINDAILRVMGELVKDASAAGANAIVGLRVQLEPVPSKGSALLMVSVYGTACVISDIADNGD